MCFFNIDFALYLHIQYKYNDLHYLPVSQCKLTHIWFSEGQGLFLLNWFFFNARILCMRIMPHKILYLYFMDDSEILNNCVVSFYHLDPIPKSRLCIVR